MDRVRKKTGTAGFKMRVGRENDLDFRGGRKKGKGQRIRNLGPLKPNFVPRDRLLGKGAKKIGHGGVCPNLRGSCHSRNGTNFRTSSRRVEKMLSIWS